MHRLTLAYVAATLMMMSALPASAQSLYTCGQGTVRSIQTFTEIATNGTAGLPTEGAEASRTQYVVAVQLNDVVYTGRSAADVSWNFDPTSLTMNEKISVCANNAQMVLDRADGTDYRARIVSVNVQPRLTSRCFTGAENIPIARQSAVEGSRRPDSRP